MTVSRAVLSAATAMLAAGTIAACSGGDQGEAPASSPAPTSSASSAAGSDGATGTAPRVSDPLKIDNALANPCDALAPDQVDQLGMTSGRKEETPTGPKCTWRGQVYSSNAMTVHFATANDLGLDNVYNKKSENAYFEPITIEGYPAVYASQVDSRAKGVCDLWVGVSDQRMVQVEANLSEGPNKPNPCPVAERTAKAMITHLKSQA